MKGVNWGFLCKGCIWALFAAAFMYLLIFIMKSPQDSAFNPRQIVDNTVFFKTVGKSIEATPAELSGGDGQGSDPNDDLNDLRNPNVP